jgi:hypothetical protein
MSRWQQYHQPPRALHKAQLDNILLIPASALPEKAKYQAIANGLPQGDVLIVQPSANRREGKLFESIVARFRANGRAVTTIAGPTR